MLYNLLFRLPFWASERLCNAVVEVSVRVQFYIMFSVSMYTYIMLMLMMMIIIRCAYGNAARTNEMLHPSSLKQ